MSRGLFSPEQPRKEARPGVVAGVKTAVKLVQALGHAQHGALQRGHGKAVDFWALGCLLFELLQGKSPFAAPHAHASYQLTLQGTVTYPETLPPHAEDLISQLLQKSLSKRLGNMKGGFQDIKEHPFCEGLDWEHPERLRVNTEPRPFDREAHEWLPGEVVLASSAPRQDVETQALFHGF